MTRSGTKAKPTVISLFSGAGGLDYGFEAAGFETRVALERDGDSCKSLLASRPSRPVIHDDIFRVTTEQILEQGTLRRGEVDVLIGGPPCQPFSKAGWWKNDSGRLDDPRANTLSAYMRVVEEAQPRAFLLENVEGLTFRGKDEGLRFLHARLAEINRKTKSKYEIELQKVDAANYGVPQHRERVLLVASRDGGTFRFPDPTHGATTGQAALFGDAALLPFRTAWDAIGDLDPPAADEDLRVRGKWADLLPSIPEGSNYLFHTDRGEGKNIFGWRRRYWTFLLKLAKTRPSWTLQAQPGPAVGPFHWDNRRLSLRELCRLQTFPDNVTIVGGRSSVQRQLGNAVPSLLAEVIAGAIATQFLGLKPRRELRLMPAALSPVPPARKPARVPTRFLEQVGDHAPHPGTGKGFGALARAAL